MPLGPLRDLGPIALSWTSALTSVMDGAAFRTEYGSGDVFEAESGKCAVDAIVAGVSLCEVHTPLTRLTYANLARIIPGHSQSGGESGNIKVYSHLSVGVSMYDGAAELIVKRIVNGAVDTSQQHWLHLPKAYPVPRFDVTLDVEGQAGFLVVWRCFPDATTHLLWHIGDITV